MTASPSTAIVCRLAWRPLANLDGPNARLHRMQANRRKRYVANLVGDHLTAAGWPRSVEQPSVCTITVRASKVPLPDKADNQGAMLKSTIDAIARFMGVDDYDRSLVKFEVRWERGEDGTEIRLEAAA